MSEVRSSVATRDGIRPPKFADKFALLDFAAEPMPAISLFPVPAPGLHEATTLSICGLDCKPRELPISDLCALPEAYEYFGVVLGHEPELRVLLEGDDLPGQEQTIGL
jgi:hypothetical protein